MWSVFLPSEWNGAVLILRYWISDEQMPLWAWVLVFFAFFLCMTTVGVRIYGEIEFYLGWFKIASLGLCFLLSILYNVGAFGTGYIGFRYWGPPYGASNEVTTGMPTTHTPSRSNSQRSQWFRSGVCFSFHLLRWNRNHITRGG